MRPFFKAIIYIGSNVGLFGVGFVTDSLSSGFMMLLLGIIIDILLEIFIAMEGVGEPVEIIRGEANLRKVIEEMKERAYTKFYAIWCGVYTTFDVRSYFIKEGRMLEYKPANFELLRLLNVPESTLQEHVELTQKQREGGKYKIKKTDVACQEIHYCDYKKGEEIYYQAFTVFLREDRHPDIGIFVDSKKDPTLLESVRSIRDTFLREWLKGEKIEAN
jgi:hypothetical protein